MRLTAIIKRESPPPSRDLYRVRMELASALIYHLKSEDWVLYPPLLNSSDARVADTARAFSEEMGGLAKIFKDYTERWGADAIEADWTSYQYATREILGAMSYRMKREERDLYPLLVTTIAFAA
jgi:hypothetical protein